MRKTALKEFEVLRSASGTTEMERWRYMCSGNKSLILFFCFSFFLTQIFLVYELFYTLTSSLWNSFRIYDGRVEKFYRKSHALDSNMTTLYDDRNIGKPFKDGSLLH